MRVSLVGSVNSGKTQLFQRLSKTKISELGGNTECIRTYTLATGLELIDCPGHQALTALRQDAIRMCDLIVYLVDATGYQAEPIKNLLQVAGVPYVIVLNKWDLLYAADVKKPIKEVRNRPHLAQDLHRILDPLYQVGLDCTPFPQVSTSLHGVVIPLSAKWGWGVDLLSSVLSKLALTSPTSAYLYDRSTGQAGVKEYMAVGKVSPTSRLSDGRTVGQVFKKHLDRYQLRAGVALDRIVPVDGAPLRPPILTRVVSANLLNFCKKRDIRTLKVYTETQEQWHCVQNMCPELKVIRISKRSLEDSEGITLGVGPKTSTHHQLQPLAIRITDESLLRVLSTLEETMRQVAEAEQRARAERFSQAVVVELDPRYVFYNTSKCKVLGLTVLDGTLKPETPLWWYRGSHKLGSSKVVSLQDRHQKVSTWGKSAQPVAARMVIEQDFPVDQVLLGFHAKILAQKRVYLAQGKIAPQIRAYYQRL